jgi:signal transduction histidine kinase
MGGNTEPGDIHPNKSAVKTEHPASLRLLPGLLVTVAAVAVFSLYTIAQLRGLTRLQNEIIDRNRTDSLLLLRIQNNLNALGTAMRDMVDSSEPYPLTAWRSQFQRIRADLEDAVVREASVAPANRTEDQTRYLAASLMQFWNALDRVFLLAGANETEAKTQIRLSLQARHDALASTVARLLVQNHDREQAAAAETQDVYRRVERDVYIFMGAVLLVIAFTSVHLLRYNRRVFNKVTALSERRSELAQQLISAQENTLQTVSRELHDDFGQTLTAVGMALHRAQRGLSPAQDNLREDLHDAHQALQTMLDRMRGLSHALHPVILDEMGLEGALESYVPTFERRTGIAVRFVKSGQTWSGDRQVATHVYRVFQEALNNVARHSGATCVEVRFSKSGSSALLEIEDDGTGFRQRTELGMGLVSMRERAEMLHGAIEFLEGSRGGALIRLLIPVEKETPSVRAVIESW